MKEIYVFGAGASKDSVGTPLGMELVWQYYQDCCMWTPIRGGIPDNSEANEDFINYVDFLRRIKDYFPEFSKETDIFLHRGINMYSGPYNLKKHHYVDDLLRRVFERRDYEFANLLKYLIYEHIVGAGFSRPNKSYKEFIIKLKNTIESDVSIISFNFDCFLHEDFYEHVYFDYIIEFDDINEHRKDIYKRQQPIPLIKLNGSLDWGKCNECNKLHLLYPHMGRESYKQIKCSFCNAMLSPYIVIPHDKYNGIINLLWEKARENIKYANVITIIGYSFPEYDQKVIDLFRDNINTEARIIVVDYINHGDLLEKNNEIREKYKRLFPKNKNNIEVHLNGFGNFIHERL